MKKVKFISFIVGESASNDFVSYIKFFTNKKEAEKYIKKCNREFIDEYCCINNRTVDDYYNDADSNEIILIESKNYKDYDEVENYINENIDLNTLKLD